MEKIIPRELKDPNAFMLMGEMAVKTGLAQRRVIVTIVTVLALAAAGYFGMNYWTEKQELKAQVELFKIQNELDVKRDKWTPEEKSEGLKTYADRYADFVMQNPGRKASFLAAIEGAGLKFEAQDFAGARDLLKKVSDRLHSGSFYYGLIQTQLATALAASGAPQESVEILQKVLDAKKQEHLHADASLRLGLVYEEMGEVEKAKAQYLKTSQEYAQTDAGRSAKAYLRLLQLKSKG